MAKKKIKPEYSKEQRKISGEIRRLEKMKRWHNQRVRDVEVKIINLKFMLQGNYLDE